MASEHCIVCDHTEAQTSAADYMFRLRIFDTETKLAYFAPLHLRCVGPFLVDRPTCLMQSIGRIRDLDEAERIARLEEKRAKEEATHTFEEPTYESTQDSNSSTDSRLDGASSPEGSAALPSTGNEPPARPDLRLLA